MNVALRIMVFKVKPCPHVTELLKCFKGWGGGGGRGHAECVVCVYIVISRALFFKHSCSALASALHQEGKMERD